MFATLITVALFAASTFTGVVADYNIDTPTLTQCQKVTVSWDKSAGETNLILVHPSDPCGAVVHDFGDFTNNTLTWVVSYAAGTQLLFSSENAAGDEAWSGAMTVAKSDDTSCLSAASVSASGSASHTSAQSTSAVAHATVGAAGAAVTGGSDSGSSSGDDSGSTGPLGAASGGSSGAAALHMNPFMVLCALFAVAFAL